MPSKVVGFGDTNQIMLLHPPIVKLSCSGKKQKKNKMISSSNKCDQEEESTGVAEKSSGPGWWVWRL